MLKRFEQQAAAVAEQQTAAKAPAKGKPKAKKPAAAAAAAAAGPDLHKYVNKQRTLVFCSRGITHRDRHFMQDVRDLLPHSKKDVKLDHKDSLSVVNEVAELKNCNNVIFLESRKHKDLYMWIGRAPNGPSAKFLVQNVHTMAEVKLTGNSLKGSRPLLCFDAAFESAPHWGLMKTVLTQVFGSPKGHPKVKPFVDHVLSFFIADGRIWFRNYQIVYSTDETKGTQKEPVLVEIGPRFVLQPIKVFEGSFGGQTLWDNPAYVSPQVLRAQIGAKRSARYQERVQSKKQRRDFVATARDEVPDDELREVFETEAPEAVQQQELARQKAAADTALSAYAKTAVQKRAIETAELANAVLKQQAAAASAASASAGADSDGDDDGDVADADGDAADDE